MPRLIARRPAAWTRPVTKRALLVLSDKSMASEAQFRELFEAHKEYLYRLARKLSGNVATTEDLVQETFCRALQRFDKFEAGTNARAWLSTILTNYYFDLCKHDRVVKKGEEDLVATPEVLEHDSMIETISDEDLHAAIQKLEPEHREVIKLCYLKQMRYHEAAEALGLPIGTIGTRLMRARKRLKARLSAIIWNGRRRQP